MSTDLRQYRMVGMSLVMLLFGLFFNTAVFAANPYYNGTTMFVYGTSPTSDFTHQALLNSYKPLDKLNAVRIVYSDVSGLTGDQMRSLMQRDVANNPSTGYVMGSVGHGDSTFTTSPGLKAPLNRPQMVDAVNNAFSQNGVRGWIFEDACGSGASCSLWNPAKTPAINGLFTSTRPGIDGNDTNYGNGWLSDYGEDFRTMLSNAGKGGGPGVDADVNHDGILTGREVGDYLNKHNPGQYKIPKEYEDEPMFFANKDVAAQYAAKRAQTLSVTTNYYYIAPYAGIIGTPEDSLQKNLSNSVEESNNVKQISDQKQQELAYNSRPGGKGQVVELSGLSIHSGDYRVGAGCQKNEAPGMPSEVILRDFDETKFIECPKQVLQGTSQDSSVPNHGNPVGLGLGGLQSILPLLMQGLLGGGQGAGFGQQNPNGYGAGYGNQQQNQCMSQGVSPACGKDETTYNNTCYANLLGGGVKNQGVCVQATPSPTPNVAIISQTIIDQLQGSGIPGNLVESVSNSVSSILSSIISGAGITETVVR